MVTVTTTVVTDSDSNNINVFSYSTLGPTYYDGLKVTTIATLSANGIPLDSNQLTPQPSLTSQEYVSLGGTTLNNPGMPLDLLTVTTTTTWNIPHDTGWNMPINQTVTVILSNNNCSNH